MGVNFKRIATLMCATVMIFLLLSTSCDARSRRKRAHSKIIKGKYMAAFPTLPASFIDGFPKEICPFNLTQKLAHDVEVHHKYAVVSSGRFNDSHPCGSKIKVSCVEPFEDLGGPTNLCRSKQAFILTVIASSLEEDLGDDLLYLSSKIFSQIADPEQDFIRVALHPTK